MTILLLAAAAVLAGLYADARRRLAAERERHATEITLARRAWVDANERARDAHRLAAGWRAHAAKLETFTVVLAPREPQGDADPIADTAPNLRAVEGPGAFASAIARDPDIIEAAAHAGIRVSVEPGPDGGWSVAQPMRLSEVTDCPGCAGAGTAGCARCCTSAGPEDAA